MTFDPSFRQALASQGDPMANIRTPEYGDPFDSRYGGPIPWDQRIKQWSSFGEPAGDRPFEGLGKVNLSQTLPTAPAMLGPREPTAPPSALGPPQPGVFEGLARGLVGIGTQFIPNQDIANVINNVAGFVGSLPDFPFKLLPSMEFLPGGADVETVYNKVAAMQPEDELRLEYEQYMAKEPTNRLRLMAEYLNSRGQEVTEALGVTGAAAEMFMPSLDFSEQMRRLIFGGLDAGAGAVRRTFTGTLRNADADILQADPTTLAPELQELRERFHSGDITHDQFLDELSIGRYRWTNDDGPIGMGLSFIMDVISDPLTWVSFGVGGALKSAATGSVRLGVSRVAQAVDKAGRTEDILSRISATSGKSVADLKGVGSDPNRLIHDWVKQNDPSLHSQAIGTMNRRQRGLYHLEPVVMPVADIVNRMDNPFSWLSPIPNAFSRHFGNQIARSHTRGYFNAFGYRRVKGVQDFFGEHGLGTFQRYAAIAAENINVALHQRAINKEVLATDPEIRGHTPDDLIGKRRGHEDGEIGESEELTMRVMETNMPAGEVGPAGFEAGLTRERERLVEPLVKMSGQSEPAVRAFLNQADRQTLSFVHSLNFGRQIDEFVTQRARAIKEIDDQIARTTDPAVIKTLTDQRALAENLTLISDRLLTADRAELLLKALNGDKAALKALNLKTKDEAARWAVNHYDQLDAQYADTALSDIELARRMKAHVKALLKKGPQDKGRLTTRLDDAELQALAPEMYRLMGKQDEGMYSVGHAPADRWGKTYDETGALVGVNSFVDVVTDGVDNSVTRAFGKRDIIRHGLLDGISGGKLHFQARERFVELGIKEYGLNKVQGRKLFDAIRAESMKREIGARGFKAEDITSIAHDLGIKASHDAQKIGERGFLELTVRAWEGELATVGLSSKVSGKFKSTAVQRTNNLVGRISETLYPMWRFGLSPMFLAMELTEGPFFAILRGIKPGMRWTEQDIRLNSILHYTRNKTRYNDQLEKVQLNAIDSRAAREIVGLKNGRFTRYWNKLAPERWQRQNRYAGNRVGGIYDYKEMLYIRQWGNDAALEMKRNAMAIYPEVWRKWEAELGTADPTKIYMAIMEERGLFDTSVRHNLHMFDAAKPTNMGRRERIRLGDVAKFVSGGTIKELRDAVRGANPTITHNEFVQKYTRAGLSKQYAERAYTVTHGLDELEWDAGIDDVFPDDPKAATAFKNNHKLFATLLRQDYAEFMNTAYGDLPQLVDSVTAIPSGSMYQTLKVVMERSGMKFPDAAAAARMKTRIGHLRPPARDPKDASVHKIVVAQKNLADPVKRQKFLDDKKGATGAPPKPVHEDWSDEGWAEHTGGVRKTFDGNEDEVLAAGNWYEEMPQLWYAAVSTLDDATIKKFNDRLDAKLPAGLAEGRLDPREELAVRMNIAFAVGQQNTSVIDGFRFVWRMFDESNNAVNRPQGRVRRLYELDAEGKAVQYPVELSKGGYILDEQGALVTDAEGNFVPVIQQAVDEQGVPIFERGKAIKTDKIVDGKPVLNKKGEPVQTAKLDEQGNPMYEQGKPRMERIAVLDKEGKPVTRDVLDEDGKPVLGEDGKPLQETVLQKGYSIEKAKKGPQAGQMVLKTEPRVVREGYAYATGDITSRVEAILQDLESVSNKAIAEKLTDFFDSLAGQTDRTFTSLVQGAQVKQPAAMDIWMKRYFGYGDSEYFRLKVEQHMARNPGMDVKVAEAAVLKDNNWTRADVSGEPKAPSAMQYEYMLDHINEVTRQWNKGTRAFGKKTDWKASEVQAVLWVKTQKDVGYAESPPTGLLVKGGRQARFSPLEAVEKMWADRYPSRQSLRQTYGDDADAIMASIAHDIAKGLIGLVKKDTDVGILRVIDTAHLNDAGDTIPTANLALYGAEYQIDEAIALMGALLQQGDVLAITGVDNAKNANRAGGVHWTFDFHFGETADQNLARPYLQHLDRYIDQHVMTNGAKWPQEFQESLTAIDEYDRMGIRNIYTGTQDAAAAFEAYTQLPPEVMAELADGSWVKKVAPDMKPFPVEVGRNLVKMRRSTDHMATMKAAGRTDAEQVVRGYAEATRDIIDDAYARRAPAAFGDHIAVKSAADPGIPSVYHAQRRGGLRATGRGSVRAAFNAGAAGHGASVYFIRGAVDATTAIHESFHLFTRYLDPSAKSDFLAAYNASNLTPTGRPSRKQSFDRDVEEWVAYEFEKYAAGGVPAEARYANVFAAYRKWYKSNQDSLGLPPAGSAAGAVFDKVLQRIPEADRVSPATWHADEQRFWEATRIANMRAEKVAHGTVYYRRDRNLIERSLNHPYLGLYPASYMWGKVLPELTRFLVKKPFGINAPLGGLLLANHAWRNVQMQLQVDENFRQWIDDHPDAIRLMTLMVPGTPWELPANAPVMARRAMEVASENVLRAERGEEPQGYDIPAWFQDQITYSIGLANLGGRLGDVYGEFFGEEEDVPLSQMTMEQRMQAVRERQQAKMEENAQVAVPGMG